MEEWVWGSVGSVRGVWGVWETVWRSGCEGSVWCVGACVEEWVWGSVGSVRGVWETVWCVEEWV